ncbi:hypothetical protein [Dactylosporangium sp. CA-233914]|uniref:hypothetical protein n=1 Tax=Dactylosporangium sp. CA-233914 TaxID=3239934 RepID=UPI003D9124A5
MSFVGILVFAVLWLACAVASLCVAARLAGQYERRPRHPHGGEHARIRPLLAVHGMASGMFHTVTRHWASRLRSR